MVVQSYGGRRRKESLAVHCKLKRALPTYLRLAAAKIDRTPSWHFRQEGSKNLQQRARTLGYVWVKFCLKFALTCLEKTFCTICCLIGGEESGIFRRAPLWPQRAHTCCTQSKSPAISGRSNGSMVSGTTMITFCFSPVSTFLSMPQKEFGGCEALAAWHPLEQITARPAIKSFWQQRFICCIISSVLALLLAHCVHFRHCVACISCSPRQNLSKEMPKCGLAPLHCRQATISDHARPPSSLSLILRHFPTDAKRERTNEYPNRTS